MFLRARLLFIHTNTHTHVRDSNTSYMNTNKCRNIFAYDTKSARIPYILFFFFLENSKWKNTRIIMYYLQNEKLSGKNNKIKYSNKFLLSYFVLFYFCSEHVLYTYMTQQIYENSSFLKYENHCHCHHYKNKIIRFST